MRRETPFALSAGAGLALSAAAATLLTAPAFSKAGHDEGFRWGHYVDRAAHGTRKRKQPTGPTAKRAKVKAARKARHRNK